MAFGQEMKDFAGGFQTGFSMGDKVNERRQRAATAAGFHSYEDMQNAAKEQGKDHGPGDTGVKDPRAPAAGDGASGAGVHSDNLKANSGDAQADPILDSIRPLEGGGKDPYNTAGGHQKVDGSLTGMTARQWLDKVYPGMSGTKVLGAYQIKDTTLKNLINTGVIKDTDVMTPELQDKAALGLMNGRGWQDFKTGKISADTFMDRMSREWASLPNPAKGGASFYTNKIDKSGIGLDAFRTVVTNALKAPEKTATDTTAQPADATTTATTPTATDASGNVVGDPNGTPEQQKKWADDHAGGALPTAATPADKPAASPVVDKSTSRDLGEPGDTAQAALQQPQQPVRMASADTPPLNTDPTVAEDEASAAPNTDNWTGAVSGIRPPPGTGNVWGIYGAQMPTAQAARGGMMQSPIPRRQNFATGGVPTNADQQGSGRAFTQPIPASTAGPAPAGGTGWTPRMIGQVAPGGGQNQPATSGSQAAFAAAQARVQDQINARNAAAAKPAPIDNGPFSHEAYIQAQQRWDQAQPRPIADPSTPPNRFRDNTYTPPQQFGGEAAWRQQQPGYAAWAQQNGISSPTYAEGGVVDNFASGFNTGLDMGHRGNQYRARKSGISGRTGTPPAGTPPTGADEDAGSYNRGNIPSVDDSGSYNRGNVTSAAGGGLMKGYGQKPVDDPSSAENIRQENARRTAANLKGGKPEQGVDAPQKSDIPKYQDQVPASKPDATPASRPASPEATRDNSTDGGGANLGTDLKQIDAQEMQRRNAALPKDIPDDRASRAARAKAAKSLADRDQAYSKISAPESQAQGEELTEAKAGGQADSEAAAKANYPTKKSAIPAPESQASGEELTDIRAQGQADSQAAARANYPPAAQQAPESQAQGEAETIAQQNARVGGAQDSAAAARANYPASPIPMPESQATGEDETMALDAARKGGQEDDAAAAAANKPVSYQQAPESQATNEAEPVQTPMPAPGVQWPPKSKTPTPGPAQAPAPLPGANPKNAAPTATPVSQAIPMPGQWPPKDKTIKPGSRDRSMISAPESQAQGEETTPPAIPGEGGAVPGVGPGKAPAAKGMTPSQVGETGPQHPAVKPVVKPGKIPDHRPAIVSKPDIQQSTAAGLGSINKGFDPRVAASGGPSGINKGVGGDNVKQGSIVPTGIPPRGSTPASQATTNGMNPQAVQDFANNKGAMSPQDFQKYSQQVDPEGKLPAAERIMKVQQDMFDYYTAQGYPEKAAQAAASVLMYGRRVSQLAGNMAQAALEHGDTTTAAAWMAKAYETMPDGQELRIGKPDAQGNVTYQLVDLTTGEAGEVQTATPDQMLTMAKGMASGAVWAQQTIGVAQGTGVGVGSGKGRGGRGTGGLTQSQQMTQDQKAKVNDAMDNLGTALDAYKKDPSDANKAAAMKAAQDARTAGGNAGNIGGLMREGGLEPTKAPTSVKEREATADQQSLNDDLSKTNDPIEKQNITLDHYFQRNLAANKSVPNASKLDDEIDEIDPDVKELAESYAADLAQANHISTREAVRVLHLLKTDADFKINNGAFQIHGVGKPIFISSDILKEIVQAQGKPAASK